MINDDQGVLNAELSKLAQANLIEAARVGDEEGIRRSGHVLYLLATQRGSSTDTAKAETVTPLVKEGESGGGKQVSVTVKKPKAKAKKAKAKAVKKHSISGEEVTELQWSYFCGVKAAVAAHEAYSTAMGIGIVEHMPRLTSKTLLEVMGKDPNDRRLRSQANQAVARLVEKGHVGCTVRVRKVGKHSPKIREEVSISG
jgi:hypothetical protein